MDIQRLELAVDRLRREAEEALADPYNGVSVQVIPPVLLFAKKVGKSGLSARLAAGVFVAATDFSLPLQSCVCPPWELCHGH